MHGLGRLVSSLPGEAMEMRVQITQQLGGKKWQVQVKLWLQVTLKLFV